MKKKNEKLKTTKVDILLSWLSTLTLNMKNYTGQQTSANLGPNSTFVDEASSTRLSPKPSRISIVKLKDQTWIAGPKLA